eukprot:TRINITY_DN7909_c0_g1_i3.p1 TRINITY_DN7909_c0_g1~~TRINITY_DN7909_c0_g1_i3.p1  ORF type:complete len:373 (-),score=106.35 TRINITY_DN7909_c0_g1_i3:171-1289(-)
MLRSLVGSEMCIRDRLRDEQQRSLDSAHSLNENLRQQVQELRDRLGFYQTKEENLNQTKLASSGVARVLIENLIQLVAGYGDGAMAALEQLEKRAHLMRSAIQRAQPRLSASGLSQSGGLSASVPVRGALRKTENEMIASGLRALAEQLGSPGLDSADASLKVSDSIRWMKRESASLAGAIVALERGFSELSSEMCEVLEEGQKRLQHRDDQIQQQGLQLQLQANARAQSDRELMRQMVDRERQEESARQSEQHREEQLRKQMWQQEEDVREQVRKQRRSQSSSYGQGIRSVHGVQFDQMDVNKDGVIDRSEFLHTMRKPAEEVIKSKYLFTGLPDVTAAVGTADWQSSPSPVVSPNGFSSHGFSWSRTNFN